MKNYHTFWNKELIFNEPVKCFEDLYSVTFVYYFNYNGSVYPRFSFINDKDENITRKMPSITVNYFDHANITFGPFTFVNQPQEFVINEFILELFTEDEELLFKKIYKVHDLKDKDNNFSLKFLIASCFSLPGYRNPPDIQIYDNFKKIAFEINPDLILSLGDTVYLNKPNITSKFAIQAGYDQLLTFPKLNDVWSNFTWLPINDDHEFSYDNGLYGAPNISTLRDVFKKNFPLPSTQIKNTRNSSFTKNDITFILLDDTSNKTINPEYTGIGYNKYNSFLGEEQLNYLLSELSNVKYNFDNYAQVFISVGRSMFSTGKDTFSFCPHERDSIFKRIDDLGLKNVTFMCGDSHFADMSLFNINDNCVIREIRNSAIGSKPRDIPNDNPYQIPGSYIGGKNVFGSIEITSDGEYYLIKYIVYDDKQSIYEYEWSTNY